MPEELMTYYDLGPHKNFKINTLDGIVRGYSVKAKEVNGNMVNAILFVGFGEIRLSWIDWDSYVFKV